jgi:hypothetical protein
MTDTATATADEKAVATQPAAEAATKNGQNKKKAATRKPTAAKKADAKADHVPDAETIFELPLTAITEDKSPRHEPHNLYQMGYVIVGKHPTWTPPEVEEGQEKETRTPLLEMATSDDFDVVREFVDLIETHEGHPNRKEFPGAPQSITELAEELRNDGQYVPVIVRNTGSGRWRLIDGGRRTTAKLYWFAKARLDRHDKVADSEWPQTKAVLQANNKAIKKDDEERVAIKVNTARKQFDPLQEAGIYFAKTQEVNPATGKKFTMKEAAADLNVEYGTFRHRWFLMKPRTEDERDKHGIITKRGTGLTDADRRRLKLGLMTLTAATKKALGEMPVGDGEKKKKKAGVRPLKELQAKFDEQPDTKASEPIREMLAWAMGLTLKQAMAESEARIEKAEQKEIRAAHRKNAPGKRKKSAA